MHHQRVLWILLWFLVIQVSSSEDEEEERVVLRPSINSDNQTNRLRIIHDDASKLTDYQKTYAERFYPIVVYNCGCLASSKRITRLIVTYLAPPMATEIQTERTGVKIQLSFDDQWLATSDNRTNKVTLWRMDNGNRHVTLEGHTDVVREFIFTSDSKYLLSASCDTTLILWSVHTGNHVRTFRGHSASVRSCSLTTDNQRMLSCSHDETMRIWSVETGTCDVTIGLHSYMIYRPKFCNHDQHIVIGNISGSMQLWTVTGTLVRTLRIIEAYYYGQFLFLSEDRSLVHDWRDGHIVKVWDFATGTCLQTFRGHSDEVRVGFFIQENTTVISNEENGILCIWRVNDGICMHQFHNYRIDFNPIAYWLPEANIEGIIVHTKNEIHVLAVDSGKVIFTFPSSHYIDRNGRVQVSFDGRFLAYHCLYSGDPIQFLVFSHHKNITHN